MVEDYSLFLTASKINNCVIKLLTITLIYWNLFLNAIRLKKCVIMLLIFILLQYSLFLECYKTLEMCYKAVHRCFFVFDSIPDQYKIQEISDIVVFYILF